MALYEVERLVRRLEEYLVVGAATATLPKDNRDYAEWITAANHRLEQINAMILAGDLHQAMQLERVDPCLSELCHLLNFPKSLDYRKVCVTNGLDEPPQIKRELVAKLNDLYAADLETLDDLWTEYNGARLQQDYVQALEVIRRIIKAKPDDHNAQRELQQLETLDFEQRFQEIEDALAFSDREKVMALVDTQEPLLSSFEVSQRNQQLWMRAKELQLGVWMGWLDNFRNQEDWQSALVWISRIRESVSTNGIIQPPPQSQLLNSIATWASEREEEYNEDRKFSVHYIQLQELLGQANLPNRQADLLSREECSAELDQLSHAYQNCMQYSDRCKAKITPEVQENFMARSAGLEGRVFAATKRKTSLIAVGCFLAVVGLATGIVLYMSAAAKTEWVGGIEQAMATNLCLQVSNQLVKAETEYGTNSIPGRMTATYTKAKNWLGEKETERELVASQIKDMQEIADRGYTLLDLDFVSKNISSLSNQVSQCCADEPIQKELKLALLETQKPLVTFVVNEKRKGGNLINQAVTEVRRLKEEFTSDPDLLYKTMPEVKMALDEADSYANNRVLAIRAQLKDDLLAAKADFSIISNNINQYRSTMVELGLPLDMNQTGVQVATGPKDQEEYSQLMKSLLATGYLPKKLGDKNLLYNKEDLFDLGSFDNASSLTNRIMLATLFDGNQQLFNLVNKGREKLFPEGPVPQPQQWRYLDWRPEFHDLMTNKLSKADLIRTMVTLNNQPYRLSEILWSSTKDNKIRVRRPLEEEYMIHFDVNKYGYQYHSMKWVKTPGLDTMNIDTRHPDSRAVLDMEFGYPLPVKQYRKFRSQRGLFATCFPPEINQGQKGWWELPINGYKESPWVYLRKLNIALKNEQIHPIMAAVHQQEILRILSRRTTYYDFGFPSLQARDTFEKELLGLELSGLRYKTWFLEPDYHVENKESLSKLSELAGRADNFIKYRKLLIAVNRAGVKFAGFYLGGFHFIEESKNGLSRRDIVYFDDAGSPQLIRNNDGDSGGIDPLPAPFSPVYRLNLLSKEKVDGVGLTDEAWIYQYLPKIIKDID